MNLSSLITTYESKDKDSAAWIRTISICLYAQFLLVSSYGEADTRIISILQQVETKANPMHVILAKLFLGWIISKNRTISQALYFYFRYVTKIFILFLFKL